MKKSFFILFTVLFFVIGCGDGDAQRVISITNDDADETQKEKEDSDLSDDPVNDGDSGQVADDPDSVSGGDPDSSDTGNNDTETFPDEGDKTDDADTALDSDTVSEDEDPVEDSDIPVQSDDDNTVHQDRVVPCTGLPENAEWNTAGVLLQTWQNGGYAPSEIGQYSDDAASSTFATTFPEAVDPLPDQCPEGTSNIGGACEYDNCGQWAYYYNFISWQGMMVYKHDPTSTCYKDSNTGGDEVPCCCSTEIYKFKSGNIQTTYSPANPMKYATSFTENGIVTSVGDWVCAIPNPCQEGFEYGEETEKCYKCSGEFSFNGTEYQCSTEIGSECRFKCREGFNWNGESCI
ncbi:hypothetical protein J5690_00935 [bacterium]|nr:hypothetical protein [bacterium]